MFYPSVFGRKEQAHHSYVEWVLRINTQGASTRISFVFAMRLFFGWLQKCLSLGELQRSRIWGRESFSEAFQDSLHWLLTRSLMHSSFSTSITPGLFLFLASPGRRGGGESLRCSKAASRPRAGAGIQVACPGVPGGGAKLFSNRCCCVPLCTGEGGWEEGQFSICDLSKRWRDYNGGTQRLAPRTRVHLGCVRATSVF